MKFPMATSALLALKPGLPALILRPELAKSLQKANVNTCHESGTDANAVAVATLVRPSLLSNDTKDGKEDTTMLSSSSSREEWICRLPKSSKQLREAYQLVHVSPKHIHPILLNNEVISASNGDNVENLLDGSLFPSVSFTKKMEDEDNEQYDHHHNRHRRTKSIKINADFVTCTQ